MADPLGSLEKILKVALLIKEAVDKVRKNKEECREIRKRVVRVSALLTRLQETEMMDPATGGALKELEDTLTVALQLVLACRRKSVLSHLCTAGSLAKRLREVKQDISDLMVDGIFATNVNATIILTNIQFAAAAANTHQKDAGVSLRSSHHTDSDSGRSDVMKSEKNNGSAGSKQYSIPFPCLTKFILPELEAATNHFSKENIIGDGASAVIYKGTLNDGVVVAIKKFRDSVGFSEGHFYDEFNLVPKLQHECVAQFVGYCHEVTVSLKWVGGRYFGVEERHCYFVQEYMPNGSLETIINGMQCQWSSRIQIIQRIADGICYLHEQHIVHSDLKPSNILLDHNMNPKISDFGIARILDLGDDPSTRDVNYLAGTMGYMPPEYIVEGILSMKYDVYSFGVILLELIGSMCDHEKLRRQASVEWAWEVRNAEFGREFFAPSLYHVTELKQIRRYIEVGLLCTQLKPADRPTMTDVIEMLNERRELPIPKKPRHTKRTALPSKIVCDELMIATPPPRQPASCPARLDYPHQHVDNIVQNSVSQESKYSFGSFWWIG